MSRWMRFLAAAVFGLALILCGIVVPAHLRAVDGLVLHEAGMGTPSLVQAGVTFARHNQLGAAQLLLAAAQQVRVSNPAPLAEAVDALAKREPALQVSGGEEQGKLGALIASIPGVSNSNTAEGAPPVEPFNKFIVRADARRQALGLLRASPDSLAQALLQFRSFTNTVLFPSSASSSGQALDTAICIGGLLGDAGHLSRSLHNAVLVLASDANRSGNSQPLEEVLMDFLSLGQRFNWGQLAAFVQPINDPGTLRVLSDFIRQGTNVPVLYSAVCLSGNAAGVAGYLTKFGDPGMNDLKSSLVDGTGGVNELLKRNQRICHSRLCGMIAAHVPSGKMFASLLDFARRKPLTVLAGKWMLYLLGGFFVAAAFHFAQRVPMPEKPLHVRGFHLAREFLFALGFLLVVLLLSEPFLSQGNQVAVSSIRLRLPSLGSAVTTGITSARSSLMNQSNLIPILLFFVLQSLIYVSCLVKLAEIRRQPIGPRLKLKLLENEDHLFDAGLYLGFVGTIVSLILFSLGVIKPSLMAAYSSTSFGIVFVSAFKIFNLRPLRRKLLLESESGSMAAAVPGAQASYASPS